MLDIQTKIGRMKMMRLKVEEIASGLHPSEVVAAVESVDGKERIVLSRRSIKNGSIEVGYPLGHAGNQYLVELPRETQSGAWRVWVHEDQLIEEERMRA